MTSNVLWVSKSNSNLIFWNSEWIFPPISGQLGLNDIQKRELTSKVSNFWQDNNWQNLPPLPNQVPDQVLQIRLHDVPDVFLWRPSSMGFFKVNLFYKWLCGETAHSATCNFI